MWWNRKVDRLVDVEKSEKKFAEILKNEKLEKGDVPAMIIAALLVIFPVLLVVGGLFALLAFLFFRQ